MKIKLQLVWDKENNFPNLCEVTNFENSKGSITDFCTHLEILDEWIGEEDSVNEIEELFELYKEKVKTRDKAKEAFTKSIKNIKIEKNMKNKTTSDDLKTEDLEGYIRKYPQKEKIARYCFEKINQPCTLSIFITYAHFSYLAYSLGYDYLTLSQEDCQFLSITVTNTIEKLAHEGKYMQIGYDKVVSDIIHWHFSEK